MLALISLDLGTDSLETYQHSSVSSQTESKQQWQQLEAVSHQSKTHEVLLICSCFELVCLKWDVVHQLRPFRR